MKDFYLSAARRQQKALETARATALSELAAAKQVGDKDSAAEVVQRLADIAASEQNLHALANQYVASQQPAPQQSEEERLAKPLERMTPDDGLALARTSRYGRDLTWNDANVVAGYQEAMRRRSRGE